jgi:hypothetical protein
VRDLPGGGCTLVLERVGAKPKAGVDDRTDGASGRETGEADRETGEAGRETGEAGRETGEADRETGEADRETGEADRKTGLGGASGERETAGAGGAMRLPPPEPGGWLALDEPREAEAKNRPRALCLGGALCLAV